METRRTRRSHGETHPLSLRTRLPNPRGFHAPSIGSPEPSTTGIQWVRHPTDSFGSAEASTSGIQTIPDRFSSFLIRRPEPTFSGRPMNPLSTCIMVDARATVVEMEVDACSSLGSQIGDRDLLCSRLGREVDARLPSSFVGADKSTSGSQISLRSSSSMGGTEASTLECLMHVSTSSSTVEAKASTSRARARSWSMEMNAPNTRSSDFEGLLSLKFEKEKESSWKEKGKERKESFRSVPAFLKGKRKVPGKERERKGKSLSFPTSKGKMKAPGKERERKGKSLSFPTFSKGKRKAPGKERVFPSSVW